MKKLIPQPIKNIYHLLQAVLANLRFGFPTRRLKVIGVTGTDGKTTTCQMVTRVLEEAGKKVAMASTINFRIDGEEEKNLSHFTTLSAFAVQRFAKKAAAAGCEYLVLETSSHSLDQYRVWGINYKTAVITNVTREHLDYHKTMERYRRAKAKLFQNAGIAIVNLDMEKPEEYLDCKAENIFGYGLKILNPKFQILNKFKIQNQNFKTIIAENVELGIDKSAFAVDGQNLTLNLIGDFNIENALAAISVGVSENISLDICARALAKIMGVPGRMEYVPNDKNLNILVDFALTPIALEKLYSLLVRIKKPQARVIAVFGSCGERDRGKRPIIGEIVSRYADFVIITNDEPYHEEPMQIINEIVAGIEDKKENENFWIIPDRRAAIAKALQLAQPDDIIAVTGMGAEESMIVGDEKIPWNDRQVILEELGRIQ
ncbi:MAG: UDP-N-acetylmuramoyl-L-alanyl-D-glutamate--2,6-diaminopimelate ligase [Parcubacteria group bacterium]